ncbi:c-type cytochrome [Methylocaldum sp. MU1018]
MRAERRFRLSIVAGIPMSLALIGCERDMADQPKYEPLEASSFFADGQSARPLVAGTVARDDVIEPRPEQSPLPMTEAVLKRGRERFDIYCAPCHGRAGDGQGMIPERGFPRPPSYHTERLRNAPDSHFYDVISNGYGVMFSYANRVAPEDRWAIAAYVRALQLSQNATLEDVRDAGLADPLREAK